ncbi:UDP-N-acetylmuramoylalanine--D-glutamate ligase [Saccharothrix carnea]|uniref:UDP-N-acetylmuramoylalanine--D-glutamate ligase n=1 Tax=Saccharothrix carnea TaxID=1280637 RepID=A0A2P8I601_SACCR|nr:UDP-N-acetylmuramoyl-L-alanine--D-glutamate ligase [Saccharothrix carnea]PSL53895.1 UDP-N-acetylmuramoylalanine--D-glutamate ligase [Saccharothrix carnea]
MRSADLAGRHVGIWGFGREGKAALAYVDGHAREVTIVDEGGGGLALPSDIVSTVHVAGSELAALESCDTVFVSPGVPMRHEYIGRLAEASVRLVSGSGWWMVGNWARTIGVTGTKGKSSTAKLIHHLLDRSGVDSVLAGNIGTALLELPDGTDAVVAELSSYQCAWLTRSPRIAVVTNLFEEHLPWHGSREQYWRDKAKVFTRGAEHLVCDHATFDKVRGLGVADEFTGEVHLVDEHTGPADGFFGGATGVERLPPAMRAPHSLRNLKVAAVAAELYAGPGRLSPDLAEAVESFEGLPHRLETIAEHDGITWIDDCLSTAPESVIAAVESADPAKPVVVIAGGQSRGISYRPLNDYLRARSDRVYVVAMPENGREATQEFAADFPERRLTADGLEQAVPLAAGLLARSGGTVLLSPGAPSFDRYRNYEEKAEHYREVVRKWMAELRR